MASVFVKRLVVLGVLIVGFAGVARGQIPALPGGASVAGSGGAEAVATSGQAVAVAAPPQRTIWGFFGLSKANCAACRQKICASPLGGMLNGMLGPASSMTGGLIPMFCPAVPTDAQVAALAAAGGPTGAEAVAAKIKQDEADAKARRAAIRYLSTASCHYWPEAEAAIIGGLRDDRNECVRYEAALALLNGCCCTAKTIEALNIVVAGSEKDGKPSELSERVRQVSFAALQGCLARYHPPAPPIPLERPEPASTRGVPAELAPGFQRVSYYYLTIRDVPPALIVEQAKQTVERASAAGESTPFLTGKRSVYHALARAATTTDPVPSRTGSASKTKADLDPASTAAPLPPVIPTISDRDSGVRQTSASVKLQSRKGRTDNVKPASPSRAKTTTAARRNLRDLIIDARSGSKEN